MKDVNDNKKFKVKSKLSMHKDRIFVSEKGETLNTESETSETLNDFFSNIVKNLNIPRYSRTDSVTENITDSTLKAILKYKDHPDTNIIAI